MHARRWGIAVSLATTLLAGSFAAASASQPVPDPTGCSEATAAAETQRKEATQADADATASETSAAGAKAALTAEQAKDPEGETAEQREARIAPYRAAATQAQTIATEDRARANIEADQATAAEASAKKACTTAVPPVEVDRSEGVDARIILAPNVCARALVRETRTGEGTLPVLVKVVVLVPCPPVTPAPPTAKPAPGDPVVIINRTAPKPEQVEADLPVTG